MINQGSQRSSYCIVSKLVQQQSYSGHEGGVAKVLEETYKPMGSILFTSISTATLLDASKENGRVRRSFLMDIWIRFL